MEEGVMGRACSIDAEDEIHKKISVENLKISLGRGINGRIILKCISKA
jgi:hypothetical protein